MSLETKFTELKWLKWKACEIDRFSFASLPPRTVNQIDDVTSWHIYNTSGPCPIKCLTTHKELARRGIIAYLCLL